MLYSTETKTYIKKIPYKTDFDRLRNKLSDNEYRAICDELNQKIDGDEIHTSSWILGSDWSGTVYDPIYRAANEDEELAGKYFGLIMWVVMMNHPLTWSWLFRSDHARHFGQMVPL